MSLADHQLAVRSCRSTFFRATPPCDITALRRRSSYVFARGGVRKTDVVDLWRRLCCAGRAHVCICMEGVRTCDCVAYRYDCSRIRNKAFETFHDMSIVFWSSFGWFKAYTASSRRCVGRYVRQIGPSAMRTSAWEELLLSGATAYTY